MSGSPQPKSSPFRFHALRGGAAPARDDGASALACSVVASGRRMVEEIQVRIFFLPRLWSREDEDEEDTRVEAAPAGAVR
jgi:hypothetical protein